MATPIDFYFDFTSPYGYVASKLIDDVGRRHGRETVWHPILLGAIFKTTGAMPLTDAVPVKARYFVHDFLRSAAFHGVRFRMPDAFPFSGVAACRAYLWAASIDTAGAKRLASALFEAAFVDGRTIATADEVAAVAAEIGYDRQAILEATGDPAIKDQLRAENDKALERGVFGSPFFIVDGEPFWGVDRLDQIARYLDEGPWVEAATA